MLSLDTAVGEDDFVERTRCPSSPMVSYEDFSSDFLRDSESSESRGSDAERRSGKSKQQQHWLRNMIAKNKIGADDAGAMRTSSPGNSPRAAEARGLAAVKVPAPDIRLGREDSYDSGKRSPQGLEPVLEHQETDVAELHNKRSPSSNSPHVMQKSRSPGAMQGRFPASPLGSPAGLGAGSGRKRPSSNTSTGERNSFASGELTPRRSFNSRPRSGSSEGGGLPRTLSAGGGLKRTQSAYSNASSTEMRGRER